MGPCCVILHAAGGRAVRVGVRPAAPPTVRQLLFIVHGIGRHDDFDEDKCTSWDGVPGLRTGGNLEFRQTLRRLLDDHFRELPVHVEVRSIEWHSRLRARGLDSLFASLTTMPQGAKSDMRQFAGEYLMDVIYYAQPHYGQLILDEVASQMNARYRAFVAEHPRFEGAVSIVGHSLGSMIVYDLLSTGGGTLRQPALDFTVDAFFAIGSPIGAFLLSRGVQAPADAAEEAAAAAEVLPRCGRFFNIFHTIDPVAQRVEPLMRSTPAGGWTADEPRRVPRARSVPRAAVTTAALQQLLRRSAEGQALAPARRADWVLPKVTNWGPESLYALPSHSSYWTSDDCVLFMLCALAAPIGEWLGVAVDGAPGSAPGDDEELPPAPKPRFDMARPATLACRMLLQDNVTGFWSDQYVVLQDQDVRVYDPGVASLCARKGSIDLRGCEVTVRTDAAASAAPGPGGPPAAYVLCHTEGRTYELAVASAAEADEWFIALTAVQRAAAPAADRDLAPPSPPPAAHAPAGAAPIPLFASPRLLFGCRRSGWMRKRGNPSSVFVAVSWAWRWFCLSADRCALDYYDREPDWLHNGVQRCISLRHCRVELVDDVLSVRVSDLMGNTAVLRANTADDFELWAPLANHRRVSGGGGGPAAVPDARRVEAATASVSIDGYKVLREAKGGAQYVVFVIRTIDADGGVYMTQHRHTEFVALHADLLDVPGAEVPDLPPTRYWNRFDPAYLQEKAVRLAQYLTTLLASSEAVRSRVHAFLGVTLSGKPAPAAAGRTESEGDLKPVVASSRLLRHSQ